MNTLLNLLAVAGGAAAAWHMVRAAFRFLRGGAAGIWLDEMARTHARHGDLTSLEERVREQRAESRRSRRAAAGVVGWAAVLAAPGFTPWARSLYAAYALLWLGPVLRAAGKGRARP